MKKRELVNQLMVELKQHTSVERRMGEKYGHIPRVNQNRTKERESLFICIAALVLGIEGEIEVPRRVECLRGEGGKKLKKRKKRRNVKKVDFTLFCTIRHYGLACDGEGEETGFELTLWWIFEMKRLGS